VHQGFTGSYEEAFWLPDGSEEAGRGQDVQQGEEGTL